MCLGICEGTHGMVGVSSFWMGGCRSLSVGRLLNGMEYPALLQSAHHCFLPSSGRLFEQLRRGAVMATKSVCRMDGVEGWVGAAWRVAWGSFCRRRSVGRSASLRVSVCVCVDQSGHLVWLKRSRVCVVVVSGSSVGRVCVAGWWV